MLAAATDLLQRTFGFADFRPLQRRVIEPVLAGKDVLAVLPTGGGKSLCFQVPALHGRGVTLVVSPLIALMQDQVTRLRAHRVGAATLSGEVDRAEQAAILASSARGEIRLLYVSPERLPRVVAELTRREATINRLAVDEAHCIVEWGHDFRPAYRRLRAARVALGRPPCIALTASATPPVRKAIRDALGFAPGGVEVVGSFDRSNLCLEVQRVHGADDRLARMLVLVRTTRGPAVVYAPTRSLVDGLTTMLVQGGVAAAPYHAGMQSDERRRVLDGFLADRIAGGRGHLRLRDGNRQARRAAGRALGDAIDGGVVLPGGGAGRTRRQAGPLRALPSSRRRPLPAPPDREQLPR